DVDVGTRAQRRFKQVTENNIELQKIPQEQLLAEIAAAIQERDKRDSERSIAPTIAAPDAVHIDNSSQTLTQIVQNMYDSAANRGLVRS
ncbi:MAG: (d)CMP kinase, partial [Bdellovibrionales bacterium]|nr:(d)CMP kinase [Bdellovibrionales bacterium]